MNIDKYINVSNRIQISDTSLKGYKNAIDLIKSENVKEKEDKVLSWKGLITLQRIAAIVFAFLALSGGVVLSVKAYISHLDRMKNMENEKIIDLYENIFQYDSKHMSRALSEEEEVRYSELYDLYCEDLAEPEGEVAIIETGIEYEGKELAFCKADGILYLPEKEMNDEQILQMIVFNLLEGFVDFESYTKATNPLYYKNDLERMTMSRIDEIYLAYYRANTETSFLSRELSFSEMGRRKVLKDLYKKGLKTPDKSITIIDDVSEVSGDDLFFCSGNCTYYLPAEELSDEQLLEFIDFQIKVDYCRQRVGELEEHWDELNLRLKELQAVKREAIITIDSDIEINEELLSQQWVNAYAEVLEEYVEQNKVFYNDPERYYANVCLIFLNDDEIPEMLFSHGNIDWDYNDRCNTRTYLYTCKNGEAVLLSPGEDTIDDFYGYEKAFSYVEKKSMVYCDYYYKYGFSKVDNDTGVIDNINDNMSRMDTWDFDTLTCSYGHANLKLLHAKYDYINEEYMDADFSYEYYINVSGIVRDENTGDVIEIVGEKVDRITYEAAEKNLWNGEEVTTLQVTDFDKIYFGDNICEALARIFIKQQ